jgi:hypothetical protein
MTGFRRLVFSKISFFIAGKFTGFILCFTCSMEKKVAHVVCRRRCLKFGSDSNVPLVRSGSDV